MKRVGTRRKQSSSARSHLTVMAYAGPVFLVGFMGAGKSSVGRALARRLKLKFEDLDDLIENREKRSIAEIFHTSGESEFRRLEHAALRQLLEDVPKGESMIVGLGGGAFAQPENLAVLESSKSLTIFLDAPVEELWKRCSEQKSEKGSEFRPLQQSAERFQELFESRRPAYLRALERIETGGCSISMVVTGICGILKHRALGSERKGREQ